MNVFASCVVAAVLAQTPAPLSMPTPGRHVKLAGDAELFVPYRFKADPGGDVEVVLHLHGAPHVVELSLVTLGRPAVLIEFNRKGLSSVYTAPFKDPKLLTRLVDSALRELKSLGITDGRPERRLVLSAFSAGFGGVREILKVPENVARIDAVVLADSLYCGYTGDPARREVDPALMVGFRKFALEAAAGRKAMLVTHSAQIPESYASTTETADDLARSAGLTFQADREDWADGWTQTRIAKKGRLLIVGFEGKEAADHMEHLRGIGRAWGWTWKLLL